MPEVERINMIPKVWMANLVLAVLVVFFSVNAYKIWNEDADAGNEERIVTSDAQEAPADLGERFAKRVMPAESAYEIVADQNLFSPDRREIVADDPEAEQESDPVASAVKISGKTITLYGVVIMNDFRKALINNPVRKQDEPQNKWISVGDTVENLTVVSIEKERVSFQDGSKKYDVLLYDNKKRMASTQQAKPSEPQVINTEPQKKTASAAKKASEKAPEKDSKKEKTDEEFKIIKTPFGNMKVNNK